ncbi:MAG TPA: carboxypeptidase-like regulatory domain-containing protein [Candidatus Kryptonia bacterium]
MLAKAYTCFLAILIVAVASQLSWGATGRITGKVTDASTGDALPGATVQLVGTSMGAATDLEGKYTISNVPAGSYTLQASYIGCNTQMIKIELKEDQQLEKNIQLVAVGVTAKEVVVAAQASGQNAAINQQLTSSNVVNVVSAARIQELPDANAAESVGRLPGISLVRNGGEATQIVIRGLQPQYNMITVDGIPIPSNDAGSISASGAYAAPTNSPGGRAVDVSMISSSSLEGIEVYKTVTPDMDAAVLGGTVNFDIREAKGTHSGAPSVTLLAQGAYNNLMGTYNDYKFVASIEKRFFDDRLGIFVQGIAQRQNLTSNELGGSYYQPDKQDKPDSIVLGSLNLSFDPTLEQRYDGTLTLDYRLPNGKISLVNLLSHGTMTNESHDETYDLANYGNDILFGTQRSTNDLNVMTNILHYQQTVSTINVSMKLSNSYSDNFTPNGWRLVFQQLSAGTGGIPNYENPLQISKAAQNMINLNNMFWQGNATWRSYNKQNDIQGSIDLERSFNLSDEVSVMLKGGGQYKYTTRYYNFDDGYGSLYGGYATGRRLQLVQALPWLTKPPYNLDSTGARNFSILGFYDPNMNFGKFLNGDYGMYSGVTAGTIGTIIDELKTLGQQTAQPETVPDYVPDVYGSLASDYTGNEFRSAEYLMATINLGAELAMITGVRYQGLKTTYTAAQFIGDADATNPYPSSLPHTWVTKDEYHGYLLPDVSLKYDPFLWLSFRGSYTTTLAYPDFSQIVPREDVASNSGHYVVWNNYALKPAYSHNYDVRVAVYDNTVGLLAVSPFLKRIDDLIFGQGTYITDPSKYPGVPSTTKTFSLSTYINSPFPVNVWGIESEWQTHFWYLPGLLSGLVLNVNYTHIFSKATYPYNVTQHSPVYPFPTVHIDSSYNDRLIQQPNDVVNLSLGYDYGQFSILTSMIYQSEVYNGTNFYNALRSDKANYVRWDLAVKQGLPWFGTQLFFDINNLNSANDNYLVRGSGFPTSESDYGLSADLGLRWTLQ